MTVRPSLSLSKHAGLLGNSSEGAILGLILGAIARQIPLISNLRMKNPAAYDAALGASIIALKDSIDKAQAPQAPPRQLLLPGQSDQKTTVPPPPWNLM